MSEADLAEAASVTSIFAKLAPALKEHIIHARQSKGHVVASMGDGINYAPALKAAACSATLSNTSRWRLHPTSATCSVMFSVVGASAFLPFLPMLPIQVLTNNLLYDFSQTAIPTDNVDA